MTDFSTLNSFVSGKISQKPFVGNMDKVIQAGERALQLAKQLPSDYASEYAVVQVMEYNTSGAATDVTESKGNISVPNSIISGTLSRLAQLESEQNDYLSLLPESGVSIPVTDLSIHTIHLGEYIDNTVITYEGVEFKLDFSTLPGDVLVNIASCSGNVNSFQHFASLTAGSSSLTGLAVHVGPGFAVKFEGSHSSVGTFSGFLFKYANENYCSIIMRIGNHVCGEPLATFGNGFAFHTNQVNGIHQSSLSTAGRFASIATFLDGYVSVVCQYHAAAKQEYTTIESYDQVGERLSTPVQLDWKNLMGYMPVTDVIQHIPSLS